MFGLSAVWFSVLVILFGNGLAQESEDEQLRIIQDSSTVFLKIGEKRVIFCKGTAQDKNWYDVRGAEVGPRNYERRVHVERPEDHAVLYFDDPQPEDNGTWTCRAGDISRTIDIYIVEEVTFEGSKERETPVDGSTLELTCNARGTPKPTLAWYRDNVRIEESGKYTIYPNGRLRISRVNPNDSGEYECQADQIVGNHEYHHYNSVKTVVQVQHAPLLEHDSVQELYAILNETKVLRCAATAYPKPNYKWTWLDRRSWDEDISKSVFIAEDNSYSEFRLDVKSPRDLTTYTCHVTNSQGKNKTTYHLRLGNKPQALQQVVFKSSTNESMDFEVTCGNCTEPIDTADRSPDPENLPVTHYRFELINSTDANVNWEEVADQVIAVEVARSSNATVYTVGGLQPLTTYQIRVAAVNLAGNSEFITVPAESTVSAGLAIKPGTGSIVTLVLLVAISRQYLLY